MKSLTCVTVPDGRMMVLEVEDAKKIGLLANMIHTSLMLSFPVDKLMLYAAKRPEGSWLKTDDADAKALTDNQVPEGIQSITIEQNKMSPAYSVENFGFPDGGGEDGDIHVLVVFPSSDEVSQFTGKRKREDSILTKLESLSIDPEEFQLDALTDNAVVKTPGLHEYLKELGGFPSTYFVRKEERMAWGVIKQFRSSSDKVVLVGSPGVGKASFLMRMGFYMGIIEKKKVLIIRSVKDDYDSNSVVYLDGDGKCARVTNISSKEMETIRSEVKDAVVVVDAYKQSDNENRASERLPFDVLATSCQYQVRANDPARLVVLPAWHRDSLIEYAELTNWVVDVGLSDTNGLDEKARRKLAKQQYMYSGGSLHEFCLPPKEAEQRIRTWWAAVPNRLLFQGVAPYGSIGDQVDMLRRLYITDVDCEELYRNCADWKVSVDSGCLMRLLLNL